MKNKFCVLLTGTIAPNEIPNLKRSNPLDRERDYFIAINKWMQLGYPVIFIENSNYKSILIESLFANKTTCEYIQFTSALSYLGKGHGEAEIIKYAFNNSKILASSSHIVKSSGRQYIVNIEEIMEIFQVDNIYIVSWIKRYLQYADSRFFIAQKSFYLDYFIRELDSISETGMVYFEHILARAIHRSMADGNIWLPPNTYPICEGISGTENMAYKTNVFTIIKGKLLMMVMNRIFKNDFL